MTGAVSADLEATVRLDVCGPTGLQQQVEAVIDTGFSGFLTLPPTAISSLSLTWLGLEPGTLADGSTQLFDVYRAEVVWDGQPRSVEVEAADIQLLLGMALLENHELKILVVSGGPVTITAIP
jgi:clan AA aspartic protease